MRGKLGFTGGGNKRGAASGEALGAFGRAVSSVTFCVGRGMGCLVRTPLPAAQRILRALSSSERKRPAGKVTQRV